MIEQKAYTATEIAEVLAEAKRLIAADRHAHEAGGKRYATRVSLVGIVKQLQAESARIRAIIETHGSPMAYPGLINREEVLFKIDQGIKKVMP